MKLSSKCIIAAACLFTLAGCATAPVPAGVSLVNANRMAELVEAGPPQLSPTETGTLRASMSLRNRTKGRLMIEGRAVFTGDKGQPVEAPSGWQQVFIETDSVGTLQFLSMSSAARQVTIELREGNR
jgi:hypothetical protein